jgi:hypothetical protein
VVTLFANQTAVPRPVETVLELANPINQVVLRAARDADTVFVFYTPFDGTDSAFEPIMGHAFVADTPVIFETAVLVLPAGSIFSDIVATFAGVAAEIVVPLTIFNNAAVGVQFEGSVALGTSMI